MNVKMKPMFICLTGIDGSGKTTLSRGLVESLNKQGIKYQYVYARLTPFILKPLILIGRLIFLRGKSMLRNYSEYSIAKKKAIKSHPLLSRIQQQILWLDYSLQILFKVKLPLLLGRNIVCDRYIYDTVINDLAADMDYSGKEVRKILERYSSIFPKPNLIFLIDVPVEIAYQRKGDVPSLSYLKKRRKIYQSIQGEYSMINLDGCKTAEELESFIFETLTKVRKV